MKTPFAKSILLLLVMLTSLGSTLLAADPPLSYAPAVVNLTGTISKESYGEDPPSPRYRGHNAWILRLEKPISLRGVAGDPLDVDVASVKEVALNVDHSKYPLSPGAFKKKRFTVTGTLYQPGTANFRRPVVMSVTTLVPAAGPK